MGVYKLKFPGSSASQESRLGSMSGFRNAFAGHSFHNVEYRNSSQQLMSAKSSTASSSLEVPEMEHFAAISEDDELRSNESVFTTSSASTRTSNTISDDDSWLMESSGRAITRTGNMISDDDSLLMEFSRRNSKSLDDLAAPPARHSTACCSDLAFRRELRKRFHVEPTVDENGLRRDSTSSFKVGNSFRRELEKEDRVESLALWEETDHRTQFTSTRDVAAQIDAPHSWHAGDTAASSHSSARNQGLDAILHKKKSSFFNGFFSGLSFSSSRKSRKSLG